MLKISIDKGANHEVALGNAHEPLAIDGNVIDWDVIKIADNRFHIIFQGHSYNAEMVKADFEGKIFSVKINNHLYHLSVQDKFDMLLEKLGMGKAAKNKINDMKAPMPGLILDVLVKEGETVKKGDSLLILEAMKMENVLKSPGEGTIKTVKVQKGDRVEKNHILVIFA